MLYLVRVFTKKVDRFWRPMVCKQFVDFYQQQSRLIASEPNGAHIHSHCHQTFINLCDSLLSVQLIAMSSLIVMFSLLSFSIAAIIPEDNDNRNSDTKTSDIKFAEKDWRTNEVISNMEKIETTPSGAKLKGLVKQLPARDVKCLVSTNVHCTTQMRYIKRKYLGTHLVN